MMAMRSGRLIGLWLAVVVAAIAVPSGFVAAVDPFGYFGTNTAGYYYSSERQFKQTLVRTTNYNALLLGDSRIAYTDPALIRLPQYKWLNGGIGGSSFSEQIEILFNSKLDGLDLVVIGLTQGSIANAFNCLKDPEREPSLWDPLRFSASWTQVWYAAATLYSKATGVEPYYHADGTRSPAANDLNDAALTDKNERYWRVVRHDAEALREVLPHRPGIAFADACLKLLSGAQALARAHGFRILIVFLPINRDLLALADWKVFLTSDHARRSFDRLKAIIPDVFDFFDSPYSDSNNYWRHDPTHFKPDVGARLIEEAVRSATGGARVGR
jgi:hypothetical protein